MVCFKFPYFTSLQLLLFTTTFISSLHVRAGAQNGGGPPTIVYTVTEVTTYGYPQATTSPSPSDCLTTVTNTIVSGTQQTFPTPTATIISGPQTTTLYYRQSQITQVTTVMAATTISLGAAGATILYYPSPSTTVIQVQVPVPAPSSGSTRVGGIRGSSGSLWWWSWGFLLWTTGNGMLREFR